MRDATLPPEAMSALATLIARRLGLHYPPGKRGELNQKVIRLSRTLGFTTPGECLTWLLSPLGEREVTRRLTAACTVGETYFFREPAALEYFSHHVVPGLLAQARGAGRPLRVWCAGCCTGEEAYTLAILLRESFHRHGVFEFGIWATDINPDYLARARAGTYGPWSFRSKSPQYRHYFCSSGEKEIQVSPDIRDYVHFDVLNLAEAIYPGVYGESGFFDVIFCRNVLMYFTESAIRHAMGHFRMKLAAEGWIFVSGVESSLLSYGKFSRTSLPPFAAFKGPLGSETWSGSEVFPLSTHASPTPGATATAQHRSDTAWPINTAVEPTWRDDALPSNALAEGGLDPRAPGGVVEEAAVSKSGDQNSTDGSATEDSTADYSRARQLEAGGRLEEACVLLAHSEQRATHRPTQLYYARLCHLCGQLEEAAKTCEALLARDKLCVDTYWVLAAVMRESGESQAALAALQSALYLKPDAGWIHLQLGFVCRELGRERQSRIHFRNAAELLESLGAEMAVPELGELTAGRLAEVARGMAAESLSV